LSDDSQIWVTLPITFPLRDQIYTGVRLYSDGFLSFSEAGSVVYSTNRCLPDTSWPHTAIYGWWADLDPGVSGARVSMFQPAHDRYVIEFLDVPSAVTATAAYTVSFQMVLYDNGEIGLNYLKVPALVSEAPSVTVAVETVDGRFFNQIYCADDRIELGNMPESQQSVIIKPEDIF
jgi:hypothetical protein